MKITAMAGDDWNPGDDRSEGDAQILTEERVDVRPPPMYRIILLNDDYTPMDFVVWLLESVFHKSKEESVALMLQVHKQGSAICGIYPYDVARTKIFHVKGLAKKHEHPLECIMEEDKGDKN